jgi:hypothetical protein
MPWQHPADVQWTQKDGTCRTCLSNNRATTRPMSSDVGSCSKYMSASVYGLVIIRPDSNSFKVLGVGSSNIATKSSRVAEATSWLVRLGQYRI